MHSVIPNASSVPFYGFVFDSPLRDDGFLRPYSGAHFRRDAHSFAPLTVIDTTTNIDRRETETAHGGITNVLEADVITDWIYPLLE